MFLSIGFASCHWCHVMRRESFENPAIASLLNERFVPVLVDREERPDVDRVYMSAAEAAGWSAGWPLNLWLTPELKPFFGGSYFPPGEFETLLRRVDEAWRARRGDALRDAEDVDRALKARLRVEERTGALDSRELDAGFEALRAAFDAGHGGFGDAPKFPEPDKLAFLLRYSARTGRREARTMAVRTLRAIADGAVRDRLGGGFHRYAADAAWRRPHYEKMLPDNAALAAVYLDASLATGDASFARIARETLDYLLRDLQAPEGGFLAGEDAAEEFYVWRRDEVLALLGPVDGPLACAAFGVEDGASVLRSSSAPAGFDHEAARRRLFEARLKRPRPDRDGKVLPGGNGLALSALAKGARLFDEPRYLEAAERTARRLSRDASPVFEEDHALVAAGLLDLYETDFDPSLLARAARLTQAAPSAFRDEALIARPPVDEGVAAMNLLRLAALTGRADFARAADGKLRRGRASAALLSALDFKLSKVRRISVSGDPGAPDARALLREIRRRWLPNAVVEFVAKPGAAKATVCRGTSCSLPTGDPAALGRALDERL